MSVYLNPGKDEFENICASGYVDKTGLILEVNSLIGTKDMLTLVSRPRRFGKSFAAAMLCAYYGAGNDARFLFQDRRVGKEDPSLSHLGAFNIIYVDMTELKERARQRQKYLDRIAQEALQKRTQLDWIQFLQDELSAELGHAFGQDAISYDFLETLENVVRLEGRKFFWICDEWDLFFREACDDVKAPDSYIELLRALFKSSSGYTSRVFAGAYFTGIMPMKVMKGESAVSAFRNYTMLAPGRFAPYVGFTREEVAALCAESGMDMHAMEDWYDGYHFAGASSIFNPRSVIEAIDLRQIDSYWVRTSSYENLKSSIELNLGGLRETVLGLVAGREARIDGMQFDNDLNHLDNTNAVLTSLVHLGYLSYDPVSRTVRIPNREIRGEFLRTLSDSSHRETARMIRDADSILEAVWAMDADEVARLLGLAHDVTGDSKTYNSEARLSLAVRLAFYTARDHYITISELPGGKGYADLVFIPKRGSAKPLLVVELKWDKPVHAAIDQILARNYPQAVADFGGRILLVGITYRVRGRHHICRIEELDV